MLFIHVIDALGAKVNIIFESSIYIFKSLNKETRINVYYKMIKQI